MSIFVSFNSPTPSNCDCLASNFVERFHEKFRKQHFFYRIDLISKTEKNSDRRAARIIDELCVAISNSTQKKCEAETFCGKVFTAHYCAWRPFPARSRYFLTDIQILAGPWNLAVDVEMLKKWKLLGGMESSCAIKPNRRRYSCSVRGSLLHTWVHFLELKKTQKKFRALFTSTATSSHKSFTRFSDSCCLMVAKSSTDTTKVFFDWQERDNRQNWSISRSHLWNLLTMYANQS